MTARLPLAARFTEEECLDEVMRLRFGAAPCRACGEQAGHVRETRNRAFSCRGCGLKVYPCHGTVLARPQPPLTHWFLAIHLAAGSGGAGARRLSQALATSRRAADQLAAGIARMTAEDADPSVRDMHAGIAAFVAARMAAPDAEATPAGTTRPVDRETLWQTIRATMVLPELERRPMIGLVAIGAFMAAGAGIGWLMVPPPAEPDSELAQATAILSLGEEKPIVLVTADIAAQLYDVTDVDADPASSLASSIRIAPARSDPLRPARTGDAAPVSIPAVRLSAGLGKSLLDGNTDAARTGGRDRPELAAYSSLARELDAKGPRNPDELLVFGPMQIRRYLVEKIIRASRATSMDPVLMMAIADKESSFRTEAQAQTSSASGLYQFIEKTWLGVVREFGSQYGLEKESRTLKEGEPSAAEKAAILALRRDAYLSAVMAAEMLKRDSGRIAQRIGRTLTGGEVYLAHFLGPDGAERFIAQMARKPDAAAAELLPKPAAANRTIFYGTSAAGTSKSLSVAEVHGKFETMISLRLDRYRAVKGMQAPALPPVEKAPAR